MYISYRRIEQYIMIIGITHEYHYRQYTLDSTSQYTLDSESQYEYTLDSEYMYITMTGYLYGNLRLKKLE